MGGCTPRDREWPSLSKGKAARQRGRPAGKACQQVLSVPPTSRLIYYLFQFPALRQDDESGKAGREEEFWFLSVSRCAAPHEPTNQELISSCEDQSEISDPDLPVISCLLLLLCPCWKAAGWIFRKFSALFESCIVVVVGFVIDERLRIKACKHKDVLRALKSCLRCDEAFHYAEYVLSWEKIPADKRAHLMREKQEHFQKLRIENAMGSSAATSKQIAFLQSLGCTVVPTSRLHASRLIEQYKSL
ncbi:hypothetical protein HHK36_000434 [Tetracentron sinense]|uniref:Uncharacterized protein n=1 Tax=Tetracentron sinense TaxID=13715 RepID=A0A834ZVH7_TETSI|nr:hypothetical protein HHK36_000434 [Tetracentron sinense]